MSPLNTEIRKVMREQLRDRLQHGYRYSPGSLQRAYTNTVEGVCTERCFDLMREAGNVDIREYPDDLCFDDLVGDSFDPDVNDNINPNVLKKQEEEYKERVREEGLWVIEVDYRDPGGDGWHDADSIGGFVGQDFFGSGYETQMYASALDGYAQQFGAPRYLTCHPDPRQRGPVFLAALRMCGANLDIDPELEAEYLRPDNEH